MPPVHDLVIRARAVFPSQVLVFECQTYSPSCSTYQYSVHELKAPRGLVFFPPAVSADRTIIG